MKLVLLRSFLFFVHEVCLFFHFQVLEHVRLPLLSPKFLVGTVGSDLLIKSDEVSIVFRFLSFATVIDYLEWYVYLQR